MGWWHRVWHRWSKIGSHIWVPKPPTASLTAEVYLLTNAGTRIQPRDVQYTGTYNFRNNSITFMADSQTFTLCDHEAVAVVAIEAAVPLRQFGMGDGFTRVREPQRLSPHPVLEPNRHWHIGPPPITVQ